MVEKPTEIRLYDLDNLRKSRPRRKLDPVFVGEERAGFFSKPRVLLDRCNFTIYYDDFVDGNRPIARDIYYKWYQFRETIEDDVGKCSGLKFDSLVFEGEPISWIAISMRYPHVATGYVNIIKYYRMINDIPKPTYGYKDTNFLPLDWKDNDYELILDEFCELYLKAQAELKDTYISYFSQLFGFKPDEEQVIITPKNIEIPCEFLRRDISEYEWLKGAVKCEQQVNFNDLTRTMYFNKRSKKIKTQLKMYQKAPGICRLEITLNGDFASHYLGDIDDKEVLGMNLTKAIEDSLNFYGLGLDGIKPIEVEGDMLLTHFAIAMGIEKEILLTLIFGDVGEMTFTKDNQGLRRKLLNKQLIQKLDKEHGGKRGVYIVGPVIAKLKEVFKRYSYCPECDTMMIFDENVLVYVCPSCNYIKEF